MRWCVSVVFLVLGCREPSNPIVLDCDPPRRDAGAREQNPYARGYPGQDWCSDDYATRVSVSFTGPVRRISVAALDSTVEESARFRAVAWRETGGGDPEEVFPEFEWEVAEPVLATVMSYGPRHAGAMVWTLLDRFDTRSDRDPETTLVVCATNDCDRACGACESRVCADPLILVGVPNLEGLWELEADSLPFPISVRIRQDGERLLTIMDELEASVEDGEIRFALREERYSGTLRSPDAADGEILGYAEAGGDVAVGHWSAVRVPLPAD